MHQHILQTCTNLWAKLEVSTAQTHERHQEKPKGELYIPGTALQDTLSQQFYSQDISTLLILLHAMKTASLLLDSQGFGGALTSLQKQQL